MIVVVTAIALGIQFGGGYLLYRHFQRNRERGGNAGLCATIAVLVFTASLGVISALV